MRIAQMGLQALVAACCVLCAVGGEGQGGKETCDETAAVYPLKSSKLLIDISLYKDLYCDMFNRSCCHFITEYGMKRAAAEWAAAPTRVYNSAWEILSVRDIVPHVLPASFVQSVKAAVTDSLPLNYNTLTGIAVGQYEVECDSGSDAQKLATVADLMQGVTERLTHTLIALVKGTQTLSETYNIVTQFKVSRECERVLIRNGISTLSNLQNNNCQVCRGDTVAYNTCRNTCLMAVSGCVNELTDVEVLIRGLLNILDGIYSNLYKQFTNEFTKQLHKLVAAYPQCFKFNPGLLSEDKTYFSRTLNLAAASLTEGIKFACAGATVNSNCWTHTGITATDTTPQLTFKSATQRYNTLLSRGSVGEGVARTVSKLKSTISSIAKHVTYRQIVTLKLRYNSKPEKEESAKRYNDTQYEAQLDQVLFAVEGRVASVENTATQPHSHGVAVYPTIATFIIISIYS